MQVFSVVYNLTVTVTKDEEGMFPKYGSRVLLHRLSTPLESTDENIVL